MAQPITKWQLFQHEYAKNNPGSSKQQIAAAWGKYKEQHGIVTKTSPTRLTIKKSPTKKSPVKKSPIKTEMHRLVQPTLMGLPPGVGELVAGHMPSRSVAMMQATSKRTKAITQQRLDELCRELPTNKEVSIYCRDLIASSVSQKVDVMSIGNTIFLYQWRLYSTTVDRDIFEVGSEGLPTRVSRQHITEFTNIIGEFVSPIILLILMRRRQSCNKLLPNYLTNYVSIIQAYIRRVVTPLLREVVSEEQIESLFTFPHNIPDANDIQVPTLPIVKRLTSVVNWLYNGYPDAGISSISIHNETMGKHHVLGILRSITTLYINPFRFVDEERPLISTNDVLDYISKNASRPIRIAFKYYEDIHTENDVEQPEKYVITILNIHGKNVAAQIVQMVGETSEWRLGMSIWSIFVEQASGVEILDNIRKTRILPGSVDLLTLSAILNSENDGNVQGDLRNRLLDTINNRDARRPTTPGIVRTVDSFRLFFANNDPINTKSIWNYVLKTQQQGGAIGSGILEIIAIWCGMLPSNKHQFSGKDAVESWKTIISVYHKL